MADISRIEELRRRVQRDPASIAFAQLAEEYRRAGRYKEAIETCEQGLAHHPGYLSARVTLGRSYLETNDLDAAQTELQQVLRAAPENLAALRGMAEVYHRRGDLQPALAHYRTALEFARNDPELQHLVEQIAKELQPGPAAPSVLDGMSFEDVKNAFLNLSSPEAQADAATMPEVEVTGAAGSLTTVEQPALAADDAFPWPAQDEPAPAPVEAAPATEPAVIEVPAPMPETSVVVEAALAAHAMLAVDAAPDAFDIDLGPIGQAQPGTGLLPELDAIVPAATDEPLHPDSATPAPEAVPGEQPDADPQVDALERWLETIIANRQRPA